MKKIVVFEDDPDIGNVLDMILSADGYFVRVFETVTEGCCEIVLKENPDLIIMDLNLPVIGGEKATLKLKKHPETKQIPLMICSAQEDARKTAIRLKSEDFLAKPFNVSDLRTKIFQLLQQKKETVINTVKL
jgi:DNA-binding response OmpR family regulator